MDPVVAVGVAANLVAVIIGVTKGIKVLNSVRDDLHDIKYEIGTVIPPRGMLGDMHELQQESKHHRRQLIEINAELGIRNPRS